MTSVGREEEKAGKREGRGGKDCHSSEAKYPSKESAAEKEEKGRKAAEADLRMTTDQKGTVGTGGETD